MPTIHDDVRGTRAALPPHVGGLLPDGLYSTALAHGLGTAGGTVPAAGVLGRRPHSQHASIKAGRAPQRRSVAADTGPGSPAGTTTAVIDRVDDTAGSIATGGKVHR